MNIHYDLVYLKGVNKENEDAYVAVEETGVFSVIDGATGLGSLSGKMAADIMKESLEQKSINEPLINRIQKGNAQLGRIVTEKMETDHFQSIPKENRSSCGIAAIRISGNRLEYVHGGDCMIFIQYRNKEIRQITFDHLAKLDGVSIELFTEAANSRLIDSSDPNTWREEAISHFLNEIKQEVMPKIIENRRKLNTKDGYGVLDGSPEAQEFLDFGTLSLQDAERILLLSDGLQIPLSKASGQEPWINTAEFAFANGLEALKDEVIRLELSDPACLKYPRLKPADDKTGILLELDRGK